MQMIFYCGFFSHYIVGKLNKNDYVHKQNNNNNSKLLSIKINGISFRKIDSYGEL